MKRIISPQVSRTMTLGDDSAMEKEEPKHSFESEGLGVPQEVPPKEVPCKEVPPKELFESNLKNLNGYREMRKKIKPSLFNRHPVCLIYFIPKRYITITNVFNISFS